MTQLLLDDSFFNARMMKYALPVLFLLALLHIACTEKTIKKRAEVLTPADTSLTIPNITVDRSQLHYDHTSSLWTLETELYSGYAVSHYHDEVLKEKIGFLNGRKQNQATQWYPDGHVKRISHYHQGKLHGMKKSWSPEKGHVLVSKLSYHMGKAHGEQRFWYPSGELYKVLHLNMGTEEGMQQAFRKNGDLYANYEAKEGRIFGLKKAALCYGLEDETIRYEND